jgi:transketolase
MRQRGVPEDCESVLPVFPADAKGMGSRISSGKVLNALAPKLPWLIGGSADLAPSTMTMMKEPSAGDFSANNYGGRNFHFGIREHGMAAALNGIVVNGIRGFGATFFVFTDYMRPSMRLAAIQKLPVLYVLTHDSIGLGEDGPTHQPIEHLASLRAMPNMMVMRPGDANEVSEAYRVWLREKHRPMSLVLSRQNLPTLDRTKYASAEGVARGAYVLAESQPGTTSLILIATGSELGVTLEAYEKLASQGIAARLVSMPCWELFDEQDAEYRDSVLPPSCAARVAVETGVAMGWEKYLGSRGQFVGMTGFGASAPGGVLMKYFGFTVDNIVDHANKAIEASR